MSGEVYLDHAATSWPKPPVVLEAIQDFFENAGGNTGRSGHRRSIASSRAVSLARERLADLLGAETPDELIFTKNATEALNLAICGLAVDGGRIVTTSLEHNSVMRPLRDLEQTRPLLRRDRAGGRKLRRDRPRRVGGSASRRRSRAWRSSRTRRTSPASCCRSQRWPRSRTSAGVPLIVDASQSAGHVPLALSDLGAAAVAMPGHKGLLGPSGTGLLYLAPGVEVEPLIRGGTGSLSELEVQPDFAPDRYESGTLNAMGIVGLGAAAEYLREVGIDRVHAARPSSAGAFATGSPASTASPSTARPIRPTASASSR